MGSATQLAPLRELCSLLADPSAQLQTRSLLFRMVQIGTREASSGGGRR